MCYEKKMGRKTYSKAACRRAWREEDENPQCMSVIEEKLAKELAMKGHTTSYSFYEFSTIHCGLDKLTATIRKIEREQENRKALVGTIYISVNKIVKIEIKFDGATYTNDYDNENPYGHMRLIMHINDSDENEYLTSPWIAVKPYHISQKASRWMAHDEIWKRLFYITCDFNLDENAFYKTCQYSHIEITHNQKRIISNCYAILNALSEIEYEEYKVDEFRIAYATLTYSFGQEQAFIFVRQNWQKVMIITNDSLDRQYNETTSILSGLTKPHTQIRDFLCHLRGIVPFYNPLDWEHTWHEDYQKNFMTAFDAIREVLTGYLF